jgi:hypothetical protein
MTDIDTSVVVVFFWTSVTMAGLYTVSTVIFHFTDCSCCGCGTNKYRRPWSPFIFNARDFIYDKIIRVPVCFVAIVLICWSISIWNLAPKPFKTEENIKFVESYTFKNNILTPTFKYENVTSHSSKEWTRIDLNGFENLVNVLLPLFFAVALQKYMSARNEFLAFCGEVEFMAIYFMTLTNNENGIGGLLESQLRRVQILLAMMPTAVYEIEKDRKNFNSSKLYYDHTNTYNPNENRNNCCIVQKIKPELLNQEDHQKYQKTRINKAILRDIKKLEETGLGLFECLLHLLIAYIDKIKQDKSAYNTSIERDFIVKWNHINAGWGNIDNSVSYKTPILLDIMFRLSLCIYAFYKPRSILYSCQDEACDNLVWASFGALFPYLVLFVFSDILQDPFQDYKINPTVTKIAFATQKNVNNLFNLQIDDNDHHFSYDDGYDGYINFSNDYSEKERNKLSHLKKCVPVNLDKLAKILESNKTLFDNCNIYKNTDNINWREIYRIMKDPMCWKSINENKSVVFPWGKTYSQDKFYVKVESLVTPIVKNSVKDETKKNLKEYLRKKLGWRSYDQIMFSIYASDEVRKHIQQIVFSGLDYKKVEFQIDNYVKKLKDEVITWKTLGEDKKDNIKPTSSCSKKIDFDNLGDISGCNNDFYEKDIQRTVKVNKRYIQGLKDTWEDIKKQIVKEKEAFWSEQRETARGFRIDIFKNKNKDGHLKFV